MKKLIDPEALVLYLKEAEDAAGVSFGQHIVQQYLDKIPEIKAEDAGKYLERAMKAVYEWLSGTTKHSHNTSANEFIAQWCRNNPNPHGANELPDTIIKLCTEYQEEKGFNAIDFQSQGVVQLREWIVKKLTA